VCACFSGTGGDNRRVKGWRDKRKTDLALLSFLYLYFFSVFFVRPPLQNRAQAHTHTHHTPRTLQEGPPQHPPEKPRYVLSLSSFIQAMYCDTHRKPSP